MVSTQDKDIFWLDEDELKTFNLFLNKQMSIKFNWFKKINIKSVSLNTKMNFFATKGIIYVDKEWAKKQVEKLFDIFVGSNGEELSGLGLDNILSTDDANDYKLQKQVIKILNNAFLFATKKHPPRSLSLSWIDVEYVETPNKNKIQESLKHRLGEQKGDIKIRRRVQLIDDNMNTFLNNPNTPSFVCRNYERVYSLVLDRCEDVTDTIYFKLPYIDDTSQEWYDIVDFIFDYIKSTYGKKLEDFYNKHCGKRVETNEGELTEKCWKGYTQKGMKTMFGKRYPNCVKKTKK